jgi:hypothetical protein
VEWYLGESRRHLWDKGFHQSDQSSIARMCRPNNYQSSNLWGGLWSLNNIENQVLDA